jgi:hypothetical protein
MKYVWHLRVDIEVDKAPQSSKSESPSPQTEIQDPLIPSDEQITRYLFPSLENIVDASFSGSSRLASLILRPEVAAFHLPKLSVLNLSSTFRSFDDPFDPSYYSTLPYYTGLGRLTLKVLRSPQSIRVSPKSELLPVTSLTSSIINLDLSGPLTSSKTSVKRLIASISYLSSLTLNDESNESAIYDFLSSLDDCFDVDFLEISAPSVRAPLPDEIGSEALSAYSSLDYLVVGGGIPSDPSFYEPLHSLPLEVLSFSQGAKINLVELTKLIKEHESLETIVLNNISQRKIGTRIEDMGVPYARKVGKGCGIYPDWELPVWTEDLTQAGLEKFWRVAARNGLTLRGTAIDALEVEDEFEEEEEILHAHESKISTNV